MKPIAAVGIVAGAAVVGAIILGATSGTSTAAVPEYIPNPNGGGFIPNPAHGGGGGNSQPTPPIDAEASTTHYPGWLPPVGDPGTGGVYFKPYDADPQSSRNKVQYSIIRILNSPDWQSWRDAEYSGKANWSFDIESSSFTVFAQALRNVFGGDGSYAPGAGKWQDYAYPGLEKILNPANHPGLWNWVVNNWDKIAEGIKVISKYINTSG